MYNTIVPILLVTGCALGLAVVLLLLGSLFNPRRPGRVKQMAYESGMDPIHDARRPFGIRFYLLAIAFLVFDVELLFLYPWAVAARPWSAGGSASGQAAPSGIDAAVSTGVLESRGLAFAGAMVFIVLLALGFVYDWRKGIFRWR
jgi:NADH-quinone oxidoreductase subunit A